MPILLSFRHYTDLPLKTCADCHCLLGLLDLCDQWEDETYPVWGQDPGLYFLGGGSGTRCIQMDYMRLADFYFKPVYDQRHVNSIFSIQINDSCLPHIRFLEDVHQ